MSEALFDAFSLRDSYLFVFSFPFISIEVALEFDSKNAIVIVIEGENESEGKRLGDSKNSRRYCSGVLT